MFLQVMLASLGSGNNIGHDGSPALCSALASLTNLEILDLRCHDMQCMALVFCDEKTFHEFVQIFLRIGENCARKEFNQ